jgi:kinesin family member 11
VGDLREEANAGIIPRAVRDIFEQLRARGGPFKMSVSFLEVYNEQLMDLLIPAEATRPLRLVEDPRRGVVCQNLTEVPVVNPDEVFSLIAAGNRRCQVAATNMNERSNRAHRIFIVTVAFSKMYGAGSRLKEAEAILKGERLCLKLLSSPDLNVIAQEDWCLDVGL